LAAKRSGFQEAWVLVAAGEQAQDGQARDGQALDGQARGGEARGGELAPTRAGLLRRAGALALAGHAGPSLAISAMITLLAVQAAPRGVGPVGLVATAVTAGQFSSGWSNEFFDARRDTAAGRGGKPVVAGAVSRRAVAAAAGLALALSLGLGFALGPGTGVVNVVMMAAGWAYNAGLKGTAVSGLTYMAGFGLIPEFAASTLPGHPAARPVITAAAAVLGLGAHFANVIPDLAADRAAGVSGLPQLVAARFGPAAARLAALVLLLAASVLLVASSAGPRHPVALAGLAAAVVVAVAGAVSPGRLPFLAAIVIGAIDVALFAFGGVLLT
jgi:4-hydroxybenzoate polyprenyltransferase